METKRIIAMHFENNDDFSENAKNHICEQKQKEQAEAKDQLDVKKSSKISASTFKNPMPKNPQIPESRLDQQTSVNSSKTVNNDKMNNAQKTVDHTANKTETKKQVKKTKAERLQSLKDKLNKKIANVAKLRKEADIIEQKIAWAEKSPEERRTYERYIDTHCKIIAGAAAINLFNNKSQNFDRETFKNLLLALSTKSEEVTYFTKKLHE